jgi:steroid delta-isomerase-like uncharacterized protein
MGTVTPDELIHRWFEEVWNQGRAEAIEGMLAHDAIAHGLGEPGRPARGPAVFRQFFETLRTAFPDFHVTVHQTVVEGDHVACRWTATGTHRGQFGPWPASGRRFEVTGMSFVRVHDGRIAEGWNNWDLHGLLQQIEADSTKSPVTLVPAE